MSRLDIECRGAERTDAAEIRDAPAKSENRRAGERFDDLVTQIRALLGEIDAANDAYKKVLVARDAVRRELRTRLSRICAGVKGVYGPDSPEYAQVGGVRTSDRKAPKHKKPAPAAPQNAA